MLPAKLPWSTDHLNMESEILPEVIRLWLTPRTAVLFMISLQALQLNSVLQPLILQQLWRIQDCFRNIRSGQMRHLWKVQLKPRFLRALIILELLKSKIPPSVEEHSKNKTIIAASRNIRFKPMEPRRHCHNLFILDHNRVISRKQNLNKKLKEL